MSQVIADQKAVRAFHGYNPDVFTSESEAILSPLDLRAGYVIRLNERDYEFDGYNSQVIFVKTYYDPDLVGPPRPYRSDAFFWYGVNSLHVY